MSQIKIQAVQTEPNGFTIFSPNLTEEGILFLLQKLISTNGVQVKYEDSTEFDTSKFVSRLKEESSVSIIMQIDEREETPIQRIEELQQKLDKIEQRVDTLLSSIEISTNESSFKSVAPSTKIQKKIELLTEKLQQNLPESKRIKINEKLESLKLQEEKQKMKVEKERTKENSCHKTNLSKMVGKSFSVDIELNKKLPLHVEKRIQRLTTKLNSDIPEKRKLAIAEKIESLKNQALVDTENVEKGSKRMYLEKMREEWDKFKNVQK